MESTTKTVLMLIVRRAVSAVGVFLVAHAMLASGDQSAFVEMASGIAVAGLELGVEWWRKTGMVMVSAQVARIKGIPLPHEEPIAISPGNKPGTLVELKSKAA